MCDVLCWVMGMQLGLSETSILISSYSRSCRVGQVITVKSSSNCYDMSLTIKHSEGAPNIFLGNQGRLPGEGDIWVEVWQRGRRALFIGELWIFGR